MRFFREKRRSELEALSNDELEKLAREKYRCNEEPRLRRQSREAGDDDWKTADFYTLLRRSVDRYSRARHLEDAAALGISPEGKSDWQLFGEILSEKVRRNRISDLLRS